MGSLRSFPAFLGTSWTIADSWLHAAMFLVLAITTLFVLRSCLPTMRGSRYFLNGVAVLGLSYTTARIAVNSWTNLAYWLIILALAFFIIYNLRGNNK